MSLLPKLVETKDITNKHTLLEHLIELFNRVTQRQFVDFATRDFVHVERAKRLVFTHVMSEIDVLSNRVKALATYNKQFVKHDDTDRLGTLLTSVLPGYTSEVEKLQHVGYMQLICMRYTKAIQTMFQLKKRVEAKVVEIEGYFAFDAQKYAVETLLTHISTFSTLYKDACAKIAAREEANAAAQARPPPIRVAQPKTRKTPIRALAPVNSDVGLLEQLEQTLLTNNYATAKTPRRIGEHRILQTQVFKSKFCLFSDDRKVFSRHQDEKENCAGQMPPRPSIGIKEYNLEALCSKVRSL